MRVQVLSILLALTFVGCTKRPSKYAAGQCFHIYAERTDHKGWWSYDLRIVAVRGHSYLYDEIDQASPPVWTGKDGRLLGWSRSTLSMDFAQWDAMWQNGSTVEPDCDNFEDAERQAK